MIYRIELEPRAIRDLKAIDKGQARRITDKIGSMKVDLAGDVKRTLRQNSDFAWATIGFYSRLRVTK
jgi:mRNA-degrading endonuclease RelE of RelBE toxin-antitoxin system